MYEIPVFSAKYSRLQDDGDEDETYESLKKPQRTSSTKRFSIIHQVILVSLLCLILSAVTGTLFYRFVGANFRSIKAENRLCEQISFRREWRSLSQSEKHDYLSSVKCLHERPSRLDLNQSLYDDFAWVHYRIGGIAHEAAPFLSWHRYFLHTVHRIMQEECHYTGEMTYWDWSLDWENFTASPIWSQTLGFGGDGDQQQGEEVLHGHCVADGPFAHTRVPFLDSEIHPHCLSRGFETGDAMLEHGRWFSPLALEKLLMLRDYESFLLALEHGPHNAIPRSIRGDFLLLTAPFDPVFFLHHTQLDRLWWNWQHFDDSRLLKYNGNAYHNSTKEASLHDILSMGGLSLDIKVSKVMNTQADFLCYRY